MKYIKLFESFDMNKIENDIHGLLVELLDKKFHFTVQVITKESVFVKISKDDMLDLFQYKEVKDYTGIIADYLEYALKGNIKMDYYIELLGTNSTYLNEPKDNDMINRISITFRKL
jgi:hypothetical protein